MNLMCIRAIKMKYKLSSDRWSIIEIVRCNITKVFDEFLKLTSIKP